MTQEPSGGATTSDSTRLADRFVDLACLGYDGKDAPARRQEAERLIAGDPEIAGATIHAAAAAGDVARVGALLDADPTLARAPGGPRGWAPLLSVCFSRVRLPGSGGDPLGTARLLLARGADPSSHTVITECRFSALTGAMGEGEGGPVAQPPHPDSRALATLLLDAGADFNESQGLYNTHFRPDDTWIELLIARGLTAAMPANWSPQDGPPILGYLLGEAVQQGFPARVALLLKHGASASGRNHYNKRPHLENALLQGHTAIADLLVAHGAPPPVLTPEESFRDACLRADEAEARRLLTAHPGARDQPGTLQAAARHGNLAAVRLGLALGLPIDAQDQGGFTALHAATGHLPIVRELVAQGASFSVRDPIYHGTPVGHANHSAQFWPAPEKTDVLRYLLDHTTDPFDLANYGRRDRLAELAARDPAIARTAAAIALLERAYAAFNARDLDAALPCLHPAVDWPDALEGGRLHGPAAVRAYWTRQWSAIDPKVEPIYFRPDEAGHIVVEVRQIIRTLTGELVSDQQVTHAYQLENGLVRQMEIQP